MKQHYIDERTGIRYTLQGDYYLPDLVLPVEETKSIGVWGQRHKRYLKEHKRVTYANLLTSGGLNSYLADIDEQAQERYRHIIRQMMEAEGVTEDLKRRSQWEWVKAMNSIVRRTEEIIRSEMCNA